MDLAVPAPRLRSDVCFAGGERSGGNGTLRPGLQSDTGHEPRRDEIAHRCDRGL